MTWDSPEARRNAPPVQFCRQALRARGECTLLSRGQSQDIREFELPAIVEFEDEPTEFLDGGPKLLPAPKS
ncbi:MAG TPA: hypothetical protein VFP96_16560 [Candidatus Acidoferrum sp.]|jgi:hypothetical protein|nr:hypothetical protein [Candidatus Acidoferrum sp.]